MNEIIEQLRGKTNESAYVPCKVSISDTEILNFQPTSYIYFVCGEFIIPHVT